MSKVKAGNLLQRTNWSDDVFLIVLEKFAHDKSCRYCAETYENFIPVLLLHNKNILHYATSTLKRFRNLSGV